jgi:hypothetical protein
MAVAVFGLIVKLSGEVSDTYRSHGGNKGGGWSVVLSNENGSFDRRVGVKWRNLDFAQYRLFFSQMFELSD